MVTSARAFSRTGHCGMSGVHQTSLTAKTTARYYLNGLGRLLGRGSKLYAFYFTHGARYYYHAQLPVLGEMAHAVFGYELQCNLMAIA
jgi:hypothetical protein